MSVTVHGVYYVWCMYSETSLIRHLVGPENNVGLRGCWIMECLLPYLCIVTVPHIMVGLERMLDYRGVGLVRFHCTLSYVLTTETQCCKQTLVAHTVHRILCVNVVYRYILCVTTISLTYCGMIWFPSDVQLHSQVYQLELFKNISVSMNDFSDIIWPTISFKVLHSSIIPEEKLIQVANLFC